MGKDYFKLTNPQKSIWLTNQMYPNKPISNICGCILIEEKVDFNALKRAINLFVKQNDSFRIKITRNDAKQYVSDFEEFDVEKVKINSKGELKKLEKEVACTPFQLIESLMFYFKMFELPDGQGGFLVNAHHLIVDAWGSGLVINKVIDNYAYYTNRLEETEKDIPTYLEYITSEEEYLNSNRFEKDKQYWNELFETIPEVAKIPTTMEPSNQVECTAERKQFNIDVNLVNKINEYCKKYRISIYNFFMAVYGIYVGRTSNLDEFVFGTPILNRTTFKEKNTIGMYISTVPFRITLKEESFIEFACEIAKNSLSMLRHQKYPYQMLLENLRKKVPSTPNLYDILISYQNMRTDKQTSQVPYTSRWVPNDCLPDGINIHIYDMNDTGNLDVAYDYLVSRYNEKEISNIHSRILNIVNQILKKEDILLNEIEIVTPEEKNEILYKFNNTTVKYDENETISMFIEKQAEKTPDAIAVVFGDEKITYGELNKKANSLAYFLRQKSVKNNDIIGIMVNRSIEMIVAILAVLKSGGAYIPIDPEYPEDRISYMLQNSNAKLLLTQKILENKMPSAKNTVFIDLSSEIYNSHFENLENISKPEDLSYLIYTSGSTGKPKGVMLKQKSLTNLVNYCNSYVDYLKNNKYRAVVSVTTVSFDIFIFETLISLQKGLKLVIANTNEQMIPRMLNNLIEKENIEIIQTTPSRMQLLVNNYKDVPSLKNLKYITLAGEMLPKLLVEKLKKICNPVIYNGYGPSETTVFSTLTDVTNHTQITIGRPLNNTQIYILNKMNLCPIGVPGELYISGDGVGHGYMNEPELTQKSFIKIGSKILYKTGDLGYYKPNGEIVCLGRADNQVKIRGLRIELEEIEKKLEQIPQITNAVVVKNVIENHEFLCAYYTAKENIEQNEIRKTLQKELPAYMVPQYFVMLEKLPYTPNGKVDKKLLPKPELNAKKGIIPPKDEVETILVNILKDLLHNEQISMNDSFLDLGGDSLTAIELVTNIYNSLHIQITVKDIFENTILTDLANLLKQKNTNIKEENVILKAKQKEYYPLSTAQKRIYYASAVDENSTLYNIAGGFVLEEMPNIEKLEKAINTLISRHSSLRTTFEIVDGDVMQKINRFETYKLNINKYYTNNIQEIFKSFVKPFKLLSSKLFRFELTLLSDNKIFFMMDIHHSICDGTSLNILMNELCKIYNEEKLDKKNIEYKDFAVWESDQIKLDKFQKSEDFWLQQFDSEIPSLNLPTIYKRENNNGYIGSSELLKIDSNLTNKIIQMANMLNCTPYMVCLAAYYILLSKYTDQKDIIVGTPIAGRYLPELENIVGMFVNTLALRSKLSVEKTVAQYIDDVKIMCLGAFDNQQYPLELINDKLNIQKEDGKRMLYDTMFIFQNNELPEFNLGGIKASYYIPKSNVSKFEISLEIKPRKQVYDINIEYCTELFNREYARKFGEHYIQILREISNNIYIKIRDVDILTEEEKEQIKEFNNTTVPYEKNKTVIELFEEQAENHPNTTAIIFENKNITYKELNERANYLAKKLLENKIDAKNIVGILLPRSENTIVSMLAILKIGCAYMLIDSSLPNDRIEYMLQNSGAVALITCESEKYVKVKKRIFTEKVDGRETKNINQNGSIEDPFSVIYTSGSTGKPKGILTTNRGVKNLMYSYKNKLDILKYNTFLSICSISFDMFTVEIFLPLLFGRRLVLTNEEQHKAPTNINELIKKYNIDIMFITPSKFELLLSTPNYRNIGELKNIQFGGEIFKEYLYNEIKKIAEDIEIYNEYGPSEITSCCSIKHIEDTNNISIGKPIDNVQIYILNNDNNICPINIPGEICVAGAGVSIGYVNNPGLTKEVFIKNPFGEGYIYKTGDIGKINSHGELEFVDRKDSQIKIRGLRVELSEIEKQILGTIKSIKNCAVIYKKNKGYISAFICADEKIDILNARRKLEEKLPLYMVPKYITQLDKLPITSNGKINKKILENYDDEIADDIKYTPPQTEQEKIFCTIWEKLLNQKIGIENDVFESGADSLLAIKFKTELLAHNIEVSYSDLFKYKTVKSFCENSHIKAIENDEEYDYRNINKILEKNDINNISNIQNKTNNNILLFGATGFVGMHIIESFIKNDTGIIYCVVRDKNNKSAQERFLEILHFYFGAKLDKYIGNRIIILRANILKQNFDLSNKTINNIVENVEIVINSAAIVKHYGDEEKFIEVNVNATQNIVDFCIENRKRLIQISSLSVSGNSGVEGNIKNKTKDEDTIFTEKHLYKGQDLDNAYIKSKFKAERLILERISKGLDAQILRLGNITNRFSDGKFQINPEENAFVNKIKSFIELKMMPENLMQEYMEFTPVDLCADAIIKVMQNYSHEITVLHIYDNEHVYLNNFIKYLNSNGISIEVVCHNEFKNRIDEILKEEQNYILMGIINDLDKDKKITYNSNIKISSEFTRAFLNKIGFKWEKIDEEYISKYLKYFKEIKYI